MERKQEIRHEALLQLYGSGAIAISATHVRKVAKRGGVDYADGEIRDALHFLTSQEHAVQIQDQGTGEVRYQITSKGMMHWEKSQA